MSRSYKKNMGGKITTAISDKPDKKIWHQQARSNIRKQLKDIEKDPDEYEKSYLDYDDAAYSDTWSWSSDGASYLKYTKEQLTSKFNAELKSGQMWSDYTCEKLWRKNNNWWFGCLIRNCLISNIRSSESLESFASLNSEKIISLWQKINFKK